jgi:hypothetical protein
MIRRHARGRVAVIALVGALACGSPSEGTSTPPRFLDVACASSLCAASGSASRGAGPTADSTALHLGPGRGEVSIPLSALSRYGAQSQAAYRPAWKVSILARGRGRLYVVCDDPSCGPAGAHVQWMVTSDAAGGWLDVRSGDAQSPSHDAAIAPIPPESITLRIGVDDDSIVDILDVRYQELTEDMGCE